MYKRLWVTFVLFVSGFVYWFRIVEVTPNVYLTKSFSWFEGFFHRFCCGIGPKINIEIFSLREYDTENHTEKSNRTETTLKSFTKESHCYFLLITLMSHIVVQEFFVSIIPLKLNEKFSALPISFVLSIFSVTLVFQSDFQCHILIIVFTDINCNIMTTNWQDLS